MQVKSVSKERSQKAVVPSEVTENETVVSPVRVFGGVCLATAEEELVKKNWNAEPSAEQLEEMVFGCLIVVNTVLVVVAKNTVSAVVVAVAVVVVYEL